jgi:hypothetical protein
MCGGENNWREVSAESIALNSSCNRAQIMQFSSGLCTHLRSRRRGLRSRYRLAIRDFRPAPKPWSVMGRAHCGIVIWVERRGKRGKRIINYRWCGPFTSPISLTISRINRELDPVIRSLQLRVENLSKKHAGRAETQILWCWNINYNSIMSA